MFGDCLKKYLSISYLAVGKYNYVSNNTYAALTRRLPEDGRMKSEGKKMPQPSSLGMTSSSLPSPHTHVYTTKRTHLTGIKITRSGKGYMWIDLLAARQHPSLVAPPPHHLFFWHIIAIG